MDTKYSQQVQYGVMALLLDGCTVSGVSRHLDINRRTVEKYRDRTAAAIHAHGISQDEFVKTYLRRDYADAIRKRTADGHAGLLGGVQRN
jgi:DNA-binding NarL/FixJ family response regulator